MRTVRDAAFDVLRRTGMTTIFSNPGSTEIPLLAGLPDDLTFVLALHEGSVVGMATGWAIARERPAFALVHTTAGLGNAVGAIATARVNRAPVVVVVGQQDRRHLALEPFLAGRLTGLAGEYPVWTDEPVGPQEVPGALARACHEAVTRRGPAIVVVPMDDWTAPAEDTVLAAPATVVRPAAVADEDVAELVRLLAGARSPALVVGAGADSPEAWRALVALAERLRCPVWQEAFGARAGFPQDHPRYAGVLPAEREGLRARLRGHDVVLVVGAAAFRQYVYRPGPLVDEGTTVAVVADDPEEVHRSAAALAVLAPPAAVCARLAALVPERAEEAEGAGSLTASGTASGVASGTAPGTVFQTDSAAVSKVASEPVSAAASGAASRNARAVAPPYRPGEPLRAVHVLGELAARLAPETILVEETPSSRPDLHRLLPARRPMGFVAAAMGGLGFALPAAVGLRMAAPERPVVAVTGDGAALYGVQALWSAAHYRVGVLFVVLANGRYAVMDRLAESGGGGKAPWPPFTEVSVAGLARSLGCPARRVETFDDLAATLDEVIPTLGARDEPLLLDVAVVPDPEYHL